jgi:hypothetical protein
MVFPVNRDDGKKANNFFDPPKPALPNQSLLHFHRVSDTKRTLKLTFLPSSLSMIQRRILFIRLMEKQALPGFSMPP